MRARRRAGGKEGASMAAEVPITSAGSPRAVEAGQGIAWWTDAWALFTKSAALWIVLGLILMVVLFVLAFIPIVGGVVGALVVPVFIGSWMLAARNVEGGGALEITDLFTCFKGDKLTPLLVVGALFLAGMVVIVLVTMLLGFGAVGSLMMGGAHQNIGGMMAGLGVGMFTMLVVLVLGTLVGMALWFAPGLVVMRGVAPVEAVRLSFEASLKNVVPFLLYGLIYIVASIVASIPFGLGWLVLGPLTMLTVYVSYKDVFGV
jgi:uncharacterized membrane protein